jgi:hypothetical protein
MSKCVQIVGQGIPVRFTNEDAFQIVERDKDGQYCSKRVWRDYYARHWQSHEDQPRSGFVELSGTKIIRRTI